MDITGNTELAKKSITVPNAEKTPFPIVSSFA
jgi:hypothetical protein